MILLEDVSKHFEGRRRVTALDGISLHIPRGEMVAIIGPSGSGKSTLLNLIGGLDRPTGGHITLDGQRLDGLNDDGLTAVRRDKIGFVFQFFNLLPSLSCLENVALPLHLRGWPRQKVHDRARELLGLVQLGARIDHLPDELSGGERQRVAIARALSVYPPILLADEPTGNLDTHTGIDILALIRDVHTRLGSTVLVVTHDMGVAAACQRTIAIRDGQIVEDVPPVRLLRLISWPYLRKHAVRSLLTVLGIVLGVAVFVAMHTANQAVFFAFERTVDRIAGAAQLQISAGEAGFPEEVLERVQDVPGVEVAVPVIEAAAATRIAGQGNILILGVDMTGDRSLRDYDLESGDAAVIDDPLVFLAQPDSIIITKEFADRNHVSVGSALTLSTMVGDKAFTVRGIMRSGGLTSAFGGNLAVMDIYAAEQVFGRGRRFDRIDLKVKEGVTVAEARAAIQQALGVGFDVEPPASRGQQLEATLAVYAVTMNVSSVFALFIGMFIIYNSFSIAVTERRSEIGILRALGAPRHQIRNVFLVESAACGLVGSIGGVGLGILMARAMVGTISGMLEGIYGVAERAEEVSADPRLLVTAVAIGVLTSMVAAWLPARSAARVDPVQALQKGKYQVLTAGENRARRMGAAALTTAALVCLWMGRSLWFYAGYVLTIFAALLLVPTVSLWFARALRPLLKWLRPVEGALAADSLIQSPRRTSGAVAALMLSLAQVIGLGGVGRESYSSIVEWLDTALNPDLFAAGSQNLSDRTFRFPESLRERIARTPGVADVQSVRSFRVEVQHTPVLLVVINMGSFESHGHRPLVAEDPRGMYTLAKAGQGVIVSDNFARLQRMTLGDGVTLATPAGRITLPIVGIITDWSDQQGAVFLDRALYERQWGDDTANVFRVYVQRGVDPLVVRQRILNELGSSQPRMLVLTNKEVRDWVLKLTDQWLQLTYSQVFMAVLVAVLGIVNTLTVSIIDRKRELGVLRAVGGLRRQIRQTVWMEAVAIGLVGLALGLLFGAVNLYFLLQITGRDLSGMHLPYRFPVSLGVMLLPVILGAALFAALWPAEAAVRTSLVEALEYE